MLFRQVGGGFQEHFLLKHRPQVCLFVAPFTTLWKYSGAIQPKLPHSPYAPFPEISGPFESPPPQLWLPHPHSSNPAMPDCFLTPLSQTHLPSLPPFSSSSLLLSRPRFSSRSLVQSFALFLSVEGLLQQWLSLQRTVAKDRKHKMGIFKSPGLSQPDARICHSAPRDSVIGTEFVLTCNVPLLLLFPQ